MLCCRVTSSRALQLPILSKKRRVTPCFCSSAFLPVLPVTADIHGTCLPTVDAAGGALSDAHESMMQRPTSPPSHF